jgi:hypothetical protein
VSAVIELIVAILLPTAAGFALLGGFRVLRWAAERRYRRRYRAPAREPVDQLAGDLRRLRAQLEATETRTDLPAKELRLRAVRSAYLDALTAACQRLEVPPPSSGGRVRQAEIYRAEQALRQRGLEVRQTAER